MRHFLQKLVLFTKELLAVIGMILICPGCVGYNPLDAGSPKRSDGAIRHVTEPTGATKFVIANFSVDPVDLHTVSVHGRVHACAYEARHSDRVTVHSMTTYYPFFIPVSKSRNYEETRNQRTEWVDWMPSALSIKTPFGETTTPVSSDGVFRLAITSTLGGQQYLQRPPKREGYTATYRFRSVWLQPLSPPVGVRVAPQVPGEIRIWCYEKRKQLFK